jgi:hypothetical protein
MKLFLALILSFSLQASMTTYPFTKEPIDVVIPCIKKDQKTLDLCIKAIRKNGVDIRRVITISPEKLTDLAEWVDEKEYPFTPLDVATEIFGDRKKAEAMVKGKSRIGWIFQQLLKLYVHRTIPGISSNVLILDADTIFLRPVSFIGAGGEGLYNYGSEHQHIYFEHATRLLPGFKKKYPFYSGVVHHMLFQQPVIDDLLTTIEKHHKIEAWRAIARAIDPNYFSRSSMSEYEIYFNFLFTKSTQPKIRRLKWAEIGHITKIPNYITQNYDYVTCHSR